MTTNHKIGIIALLIAIMIVIAGCSSSTNPGAQQNAPPNPSTGAAQTVGAASAGSGTAQKVKFSDTPYAATAYLISGATLDTAAQQAISGFTMVKTIQADGTTTIDLTSSNPEYQNQTYTLQKGDSLYFIERMLGDDAPGTPGQDLNLGDDMAIVVDSNGYVVQ